MKPEHIRVPVLPPSPHADSDCRGVASILSRVGDKWSVFVIMMLGDGPMRFNELKRVIGGISQRMLTLTLRGLERDGLITRTVYPTVPVTVEYRLTALGHSLAAAVSVIKAWTYDNIEELQRARDRYDQATAPPAAAPSVALAAVGRPNISL